LQNKTSPEYHTHAHTHTHKNIHKHAHTHISSTLIYVYDIVTRFTYIQARLVAGAAPPVAAVAAGAVAPARPAGVPAAVAAPQV